MLFDILKDHGNLFSCQFWEAVYGSILLPIFGCLTDKKMAKGDEDYSWDYETSALAAKLLLDLTIIYFLVVRSQLPGVISVLTEYIKSPVQATANIGVASMVRLANDLGRKLTDDEWRELYLGLKGAAESTVPRLLKLVGMMEDIDFPNSPQSSGGDDLIPCGDDPTPDQGIADDVKEDDLQTTGYVVSRMKSHIGVQLIILQVNPNIRKVTLDRSPKHS